MSVFLFFDESGDLNFSPSGSKYIVFGALTTREPASLLRPLSDLRYDLITQGVEIEEFHASEDRQSVRDQVFQILADVGDFDFDAVIVKKTEGEPGFTRSDPVLSTIRELLVAIRVQPIQRSCRTCCRDH